MRSLHLLPGQLVSILFLFILFPLSAQNNKEATAQGYIITTIEKGRSAGIAAGFANGENILWTGYDGLADVKEEKPVDKNTLFRTASIAKPMTAVAIMQLVEKGKLDLDQPVKEYLPEFPIKNSESITVRHLLQHSSGIDAYKSKKEVENKNNYPSLADAMTIFQDRDLRFQPGSDFYYTSYGYTVLGWIIERVSGMTYEEYMKKNIWEKAGMANTGVEDFSKPLPNQSELYHLKKEGKIKNAKKNNLSDRVPAGGFYSTLEDVVKFGQAILNHSLISEASFQEMIKDSGLKKEGNPYGMGWYLYGQNPQYGNVIGHTGGQTGASGQLMILPEEDIVILVLSNTSNSLRYISGIAVQLFDIAANWE